MIAKRDIVTALKREANKYMKEPRAGLPRAIFEQRSYQKWAVREVIKRIEQSNFTPPIMVVEDFRNKMDLYSCSKAKSGRLFSVAYDTATLILDILVSMKGE